MHTTTLRTLFQTTQDIETNLVLSASLDTLSEIEAEKLQHLLDKARVFMVERLPPPPAAKQS